MLFNKQTFERIHDLLPRSGKIVDAPLRCDRWIASSLLQKSIRRGDVELAQRAACTLNAFDRGAIWRRLVVIACEDIGVGDIDALLETFLAATSTDFRRQCGEASVLGAVVRRLAEAVKDRSGDYLACAAADHPDLSATCRFCKEASLEKRLELLTDFSQPLAKRAVAAWYASGINPRYQNQVQGGDLHALAMTYRSLGAGDELTHSMVLAAKRAPEVLVVLAPLIWPGRRRAYAETAASSARALATRVLAAAGASEGRAAAAPIAAAQAGRTMDCRRTEIQTRRIAHPPVSTEPTQQGGAPLLDIAKAWLWGRDLGSSSMSPGCCERASST